MGRYTLNLHLPIELWNILRRLTAKWNTTPDGAVRRLISDAEESEMRDE